MIRAIWKGVVLAESAETRRVEGNDYFPPDAVNREYLRKSARSTVCPWKGVASYYDVVVGGDVNPAAAWFYSQPKPAAAELAGYVAFWRGVKIERSEGESSMWSRLRGRRQAQGSRDGAAA